MCRTRSRDLLLCFKLQRLSHDFVLLAGLNGTGPGLSNTLAAVENHLPASKAELKAEAIESANDRASLQSAIQWLGARLSILEVSSHLQLCIPVSLPCLYLVYTLPQVPFLTPRCEHELPLALLVRADGMSTVLDLSEGVFLFNSTFGFERRFWINAGQQERGSNGANWSTWRYGY